MCSRSTTGQATPANGPSWLTFIAQTKDSLWSLDLFRRESIVVRSHWVLVVTDVFTRRIIGFGVERAYIAHHHHLTVHRQECRPAAERQRGLDGNAMDRHLQIGSRETVTVNLVDVAAMTRELSRQAEITQVIFNNNYEDQGQRNSREMIALLAENS